MSSLPATPGPGSAAARYSDIALAMLAVMVIVLMVLPLPAWMLDALIAINIASGIVLLLFALYVPTPLAFSTFPSVLLFTTLFRIALNVATTRQILLHAHAGDIIDAFGRLVVGGSLIVGLVIFLIITIVQFIVIAKGAERVAEVGARFTLDAMPGKQMSIDSDLRAGLLSQSEALARRRELVQESQFFGAMDGAMKFVKGDAIAGMIIVVVNLLGGMAIGALVLDMPLLQAVQKYSVLSIGDGLVTQIPALFIAMAAGVVVTRTSPDEASSNLGGQIGHQLASQPRALILGGVVMALFSLVPGFPAWVFLLLGAASVAVGTMVARRGSSASEGRRLSQLNAAARDGDSQPVFLGDAHSMGRSHSPFRLELSPALAERIGVPALNEALLKARIDLRNQAGLAFPGLGVQLNPALGKDQFRMMIQGLAGAANAVPEGARLVLAAPAILQTAGIGSDSAVVPQVLMPACWVRGKSSADLQRAGLRSVEAAVVVAQTVIRTMQAHATESLGVQETRYLLREIEPSHGDLVREALSVLPLARLSDLLAAMARDRVPLTDLPVLLQSIVANGPGAKDTDELYRELRLSLARGIVARHVADDGRLYAIAFDSAAEDALRAAVEVRPDGPWLALTPQASEAILNAVVAAASSESGAKASVLLVPGSVRRAVSRLARVRLPHLGFLSYEEVMAAATPPMLVASIARPAEMTPSG
jgi:type III secretion protein V